MQSCEWVKGQACKVTDAAAAACQGVHNMLHLRAAAASPDGMTAHAVRCT